MATDLNRQSGPRGVTSIREKRGPSLVAPKPEPKPRSPCSRRETMAPNDSIFLRDVMPVVERVARNAFAADPDKVSDAISVALEGWRANPDAPAKSIAWFACRRVKTDRQFRESIRSITGPTPRGVRKPNMRRSV